ncbi:MAG: DUF4012 domain-containing protein [Patescibacteria group bacterium]|nr:DUF4012 domain-containing protein [Patescibacteria group bacterium]
MKLKTEIVFENQKALIISKKNYPFIEILKSHLKNYSIDPYFSSEKPKSFKIFNYVFIIDENIDLYKIEKYPDIKYVFIFIKKDPSSYFLKSKKNNLKIIKLNNNKINNSQIENILWFAFSKSKENFLKLNYLKIENKKENKINWRSLININKKILIKIFFVIFFLWHILFVPFIISSFFFIYLSFNHFKKENFQKTSLYLSKSKILFNLGKNFYQTIDQNYKLFGISSIPENIININQSIIESFEEGVIGLENIKKIQQLIFIKNKSIEEKNNLSLRLKNTYQNLEKINKNLDIISQKLDFPFKSIKKIKKNIFEINDLISKSKIIYQYFEKIITQEKTSKYLVFFANNMEIRPGGGFIGSFAVVEIGNFEISYLKIYDVYDADGQLTAHLDPPKPLSKYLNLPHWFLRDSNFSPDFFENYQKALFFLEKSIKISNFDGSILLTTTAVENILNAFGNIYLPDYKEYINAKNFYLKTQFYVEKNFFPGSTQKTNFLSKLVNQIIINLDQASFLKIIKNLKKSLDEKQIVMYFNDEKVQNLINSFFWSGRVIEPKCLIQNNNCFIDYLFPYDTNIGANKANFFINKFFYLKTFIDNNSFISHQLTIKYENNSPSEIFPTGYYKNYFQILLPTNSFIKSITKDGILIEEYDQKDDIFKIISFYFEIPPRKKTEIKINYQIKENLKKGKQIYQIIFQKQIGDKNSDLILDFTFNKNINIINQNFSPLVKDNQIIYNTNLSTDKIFLIEINNQ